MYELDISERAKEREQSRERFQCGVPRESRERSKPCCLLKALGDAGLDGVTTGKRAVASPSGAL